MTKVFRLFDYAFPATSDADYLAHVLGIIHANRFTPLPRARWDSDYTYTNTLLEQLEESM